MTSVFERFCQVAWKGFLFSRWQEQSKMLCFWCSKALLQYVLKVEGNKCFKRKAKRARLLSCGEVRINLCVIIWFCQQWHHGHVIKMSNISVTVLKILFIFLQSGCQIINLLVLLVWITVRDSMNWDCNETLSERFIKSQVYFNDTCYVGLLGKKKSHDQ